MSGRAVTSDSLSTQWKRRLTNARNRLYPIRRDQAVGTGFDAGDLETAALKVQAGVEDRLVLDGRGHDVRAPASQGGHPLDGEVVRLGGTRGPDDLARVGVDQRRHVVAGLLDRLFRFAPEAVQPRRGVAEHAVRPQVAGHRRHDGGVGRRGRGVVKVDRRLHRDGLAARRAANRAGIAELMIYAHAVNRAAKIDAARAAVSSTVHRRPRERHQSSPQPAVLACSPT